MAKRRKRMIEQPLIYKPDPKAERRYAAEHVTETVMRTDPKMKAMRDRITEAVEQAAQKAVKRAR